MTQEAEARKLRRGVFGFLSKKKIFQIADEGLDVALEGLQKAVLENTMACARVRRRQSSGSMRLISVPVDSPLPPPAE